MDKHPLHVNAGNLNLNFYRSCPRDDVGWKMAFPMRSKLKNNCVESIYIGRVPKYFPKLTAILCIQCEFLNGGHIFLLSLGCFTGKEGRFQFNVKMVLIKCITSLV